MSDVKDILEIEQASTGTPTKEAIVAGNKKKPKRHVEAYRRPEGMHRELYALLYSDSRGPAALAPSDTAQGYKQVKAKLGRKNARAWKWTPFTNPARTDGAVFCHWRRSADEGKDYPFAKFNKKVNVPEYTNEEYEMYLVDSSQSGWSKEETDYLFEMCKRFDLRFAVIHDRYDKEKYKERSIEDLKDRYYDSITRLLKGRSPAGTEPENLPTSYDAEHEKTRKKQLLQLFNRTPEQIQEEEYLLAELKKIEIRRKERERRQQDLQKLITAAESTTESRNQEKGRPSTSNQNKKKQTKKKEAVVEKPAKIEGAGIKFPENKAAGVSLRSSRLKMPNSVGTKKSKAVEMLLEELRVELVPMPTEEICKKFNELRNDIILLYDLKQASTNCEFELQSLRHRYETLVPGKDIAETVPSSIAALSGITPSTTGSATPLIDNVIAPLAAANARKRRSVPQFMDQNALKKKKT